MANPFDQELDPGIVARARRGDMKAHAVLFQAFAPAVHGAARRLVRSPDVADEVVQDTFVEVIHSIAGFRGEAPVGAWIRRIAVNKSLMHLRSYWERNRSGLPDEPHRQSQPAGARINLTTWADAPSSTGAAKAAVDPVVVSRTRRTEVSSVRVFPFFVESLQHPNSLVCRASFRKTASDPGLRRDKHFPEAL